MIKKLLQHCDLSTEIEENTFPENYYPIQGEYIVFQTGSEKPSQQYGLYFEVVGQLRKNLKNDMPTLVQVGDSSDPLVPHSIDLRNKLNNRQLAYVVKNSILCVTSHAFAAKLCRGYKKPLVWIGCNFPRKKELELFSSKFAYIEPELGEGKWNYRDNDLDKTINLIKPEQVIKSVLELLNKTYDSKNIPDTQFVGRHYGMQVFDFIPDCQLPQDFVGKELNLRLDVVNNVDILPELLNYCRLNIVTKKPFSLENINLNNISSINYFVDDDFDFDFIKEVNRIGIRLTVIAVADSNIGDIRFKLLDIANVFRQKDEKPFDKLDLCASMVRSSRIVYGKNNAYPSIFHYKKGIGGPIHIGLEILPEMIDDIDFLEFIDFYYIFKKQK